MSASSRNDAQLVSSVAMGNEIRAMRRAQGLTLDALAELAFLSPGFLSLIERGKKSPSLAAMQRISSALGVEIGWLIQPQNANDPVEQTYVVRKAYRRRIDYSKLIGTDYLGETDFLLSPSIDGNLALTIMQFAPGGHSGDDAFTHEGEEAGLVLKGQLTLKVDGKSFVLNEGDSFGLSGSEPHRYVNSGETDLQVLLANTPVVMRSGR